MKIGILALQGNIAEHVHAMGRAMRKVGVMGEVVQVKDSNDVEGINALVVPGGESTTIGKLIHLYGMDNVIKKLARRGIPILGTCAGLILLAKEVKEMKGTEQKLLSLMDIKVKRNAFGRQRESFEANVNIPVLGNKAYPCICIRAPAIEKIWGRTKILGRFEGRIILAQQDNLIAAAFHPELTQDSRLHEYFLKLVRNDS